MKNRLQSTTLLVALTLALAGCSGAVPGALADDLAAVAASETKVSVLEIDPVTTPSKPDEDVVMLDDLHHMIGQMIMVGYHGRTTGHKGTKRIAELLSDGTIGGVILMQRNMTSFKRLKEMTDLFHDSAAKLPPLIAVDQEGGAVQRLKARNGFKPTPSAARIARRLTVDQARETYDRLAKRMFEAGINMNFGPVVDLGTNKRNPIVTRKGRTYGADPDVVAQYASAFIGAHQDAGLATVAKHFPGHGSSWADSHRSFVDLTRTWKEIELKPYELLSKSTPPSAVMIGHLYHPDFTEGEKLPASLSKKAIEGKLRHELGFKGLVITDDLEMRAVRRQFKIEELTVRAVAAGNDIILYSNPNFPGRHSPRLLHHYIRKAVISGRIPRQRIVEAYKRIKRHKKRQLEWHQTASSSDGKSGLLRPVVNPNPPCVTSTSVAC
jgi:beta-N-acetylhexosaminidase